MFPQLGNPNKNTRMISRGNSHRSRWAFNHESFSPSLRAPIRLSNVLTPKVKPPNWKNRLVKMGSSSPRSGVKRKKCLKPPPSFFSVSLKKKSQLPQNTLEQKTHFLKGEGVRLKTKKYRVFCFFRGTYFLCFCCRTPIRDDLLLLFTETLI